VTAQNASRTSTKIVFFIVNVSIEVKWENTHQLRRPNITHVKACCQVA
jgi:hypothetical protein